MRVSVLSRQERRLFLLEIYIELVFHFQKCVTRIKFVPHRNNILEKTSSNLLQNFLLYDLLRSIQILLPLEEEMDDNRNSDLLRATTVYLLKLKRDEPRNEYQEISVIKNKIKNLTPIPLSFFRTNRNIDVALNAFETSNYTPHIGNIAICCCETLEDYKKSREIARKIVKIRALTKGILPLISPLG